MLHYLTEMLTSLFLVVKIKLTKEINFSGGNRDVKKETKKPRNFHINASYIYGFFSIISILNFIFHHCKLKDTLPLTKKVAKRYHSLYLLATYRKTSLLIVSNNMSFIKSLNV